MSNSFLTPNSYTDLYTQANSLELYQALVLQLVKDFKLANLDLDLNINIEPTLLFEKTQDKIFSLIQYDFASYLSLLYIIDVSENTIKKLDGSNIVELSNAITFLILKREWQKVWFKKFY